MLIFMLIFVFANSAISQIIQNKHTMKFLILLQENQPNCSTVISQIQSNTTDNNYKFEFHYYIENDTIFSEFIMCEYYQEGYEIILDLRWNGLNWHNLSAQAEKYHILYLKMDVPIRPMLFVIDEFLTFKNSSDVIVLLENKFAAIQAHSYWSNCNHIKKIIFDKLDETALRLFNESLHKPSFFIIIGSTEFLVNTINTLIEYKVQNLVKVRVHDRWMFVSLDFANTTEFETLISKFNYSYLIKYDNNMCCPNLMLRECENIICPIDYNIYEVFLKDLILHIIKLLDNISNIGLNFVPFSGNCSNPNTFPIKIMLDYLKTSKTFFYKIDAYNMITQRVAAIIKRVSKQSDNVTLIAKYNRNKLTIEKGVSVWPSKEFLMFVISVYPPWVIRNDSASHGVSGFSIEFIKRLSEILDIDYNFHFSEEGFGMKHANGSWSGYVGNLLQDDVDATAVPIGFSSNRERAIDFVIPPIGTSAITVVTRKPVKYVSPFKFLTVLNLEVWLVIIGVILGAAFVLWILHLISPYSSRNTKYSYQCRNFNLKQSIWFAITSLTPYGGGEPPQALSGRILVAAYWTFIILILATFIANLSSLLILERAQYQVQKLTLHQLATQSKIKYTVKKNSFVWDYFLTLKKAEDYVFEMWKALVFYAEENEFHVNKYPIEEIYNKIFKTIQENEPVPTATAGFDRVLETTDGTFAFIHDVNEIRYQLGQHCELVEITEPFGERPISFAVPEGSNLAKKIGKAIIKMKQEKFIHYLTEKYWSYTKCEDINENTGIDIYNLGGLFVIILSGVFIAVVILAIESNNKVENLLSKLDKNILSTKNSVNKNKILLERKNNEFDKVLDNKKIKEITFGTEFNPKIIKTAKDFEEYCFKAKF